MIQVRFDEQSRSRLVLIWESAEREPVQEVDAGAANLLFAVLAQGKDAMIVRAASAAPARRTSAPPRRRKLRGTRAKAH